MGTFTYIVEHWHHGRWIRFEIILLRKRKQDCWLVCFYQVFAIVCVCVCMCVYLCVCMYSYSDAIGYAVDFECGIF